MDEEKKKESRSKITALLLVCLAGILSVALAACGKAGSGTEDGKGTNLTDGEPSGAYIEEEIAFPAAIQKREKGIYSILLSPDGDVVLYAGSQDEKAKQQIVRYTLQPDDTWKEEEEPWMTSIEWNERHMAGSFSYDPAGNLYITALRRVDTSPEDALPEESSSDRKSVV